MDTKQYLSEVQEFLKEALLQMDEDLENLSRAGSSEELQAVIAESEKHSQDFQQQAQLIEDTIKMCG